LITLATFEFIRRFLIHSAAQRLAPHPPLRPVRQRRLRDNVARARKLLASQNLATLSMLRRSHDHHRGVRARGCATVSADSPNEPHQDRHLMTASQSCKSALRARWPSISHGSARPHIHPSSQIVRQFVELDATRRAFASLRIFVGGWPMTTKEGVVHLPLRLNAYVLMPRKRRTASSFPRPEKSQREQLSRSAASRGAREGGALSSGFFLRPRNNLNRHAFACVVVLDEQMHLLADWRKHASSSRSGSGGRWPSR
jgi:hypothetical protein